MLIMDRIELYSRGLESSGLWLAQVGGGSSLTDAFRDFYRSAIETVPQFMAAFLMLLVFALAALIAWQVTRAAVARINIPVRICFLLARLAFIGILSPGGVIALAVATGVPFGRVFTGFGLLSVGIGFALKNPLKNMVSGILTILTGPFRIGDEIEVSGYGGLVEAINIQSIPVVRSSREPIVLVREFGESSVNRILRFWSDPTRQDNSITSIVTARTKEAFDEAGITIPFTIWTLHLPSGANGTNGAENNC